MNIRKTFLFAICLSLAFPLGCLNGTHPSSPEEAVFAYFGAISQGDAKTLSSLAIDGYWEQDQTLRLLEKREYLVLNVDIVDISSTPNTANVTTVTYYKRYEPYQSMGGVWWNNITFELKNINGGWMITDSINHNQQKLYSFSKNLFPK